MSGIAIHFIVVLLSLIRKMIAAKSNPKTKPAHAGRSVTRCLMSLKFLSNPRKEIS